MVTFFDAFWPNLASTLIGLVLGLPVALWINRRATAHNDAAIKRGQETRLANALDVLVAAMRENAVHLARLNEVVADSKAGWYFALDTSAWDAIKGDIAPELTPPELRRKLAFHFGQLSALKRLNEHYLSFAFGVNASMENAAKTRDTLKSNLLAVSKTALTEVHKLIQGAGEVRSKILPSITRQQ